jgi:hypothetical protein
LAAVKFTSRLAPRTGHIRSGARTSDLDLG